MIEENCVHSLADVVVSAEGKRQIANATANVCTRQIFSYPRRCLDKVERISIVLRNTRCNGKDVRVKNYIASFKTDNLSE